MGGVQMSDELFEGLIRGETLESQDASIILDLMTASTNPWTFSIHVALAYLRLGDTESAVQVLEELVESAEIRCLEQ